MEDTLRVKVVDKKEDEIGEFNETDAFLELHPVKKSDNLVLRKLLRGPRYFDPASNWGNCCNCGESDHTVASCAVISAVNKRKKPCYICASFEHDGRHCEQGKGCLICNKKGHRAKNCPEKSVEGFRKTDLCLKCGDSGHDMFTCKSAYSLDDLKEIQCYLCKGFGHLCCTNYCKGLSDVSCYRCGQLGHNGLECQSSSVPAETTNTTSRASCRKCGEEGHKGRKRQKRRKRNNGKQCHLNDNRDNPGVKSAPHELSQAYKRNKMENGYSNSSQPKRTGGSIIEDRGNNGTQWGPPSTSGWINKNPVDHHGTQWRSPSTPDNYRSNDSFHEEHGVTGNDSGFQFDVSGSNGYQHSFQHPDLANPAIKEQKNKVEIISLGGTCEN
ncbi:uncharacterized protein [Rutidosis leptorrhynchoides]|uniref:uncharacterized protein n=1 Tax=Rutidosis leptorrhynchoides TaxID=125765 RepID=UPI003A994587